jgi:hypothetical protein
LPINIYELLTPIALTYWIAGDGSYDKKNRNVIICTDSQTYGLLEKLQEVFKNKFDINSTRVLSGSSPNSYRIRIPAKEVSKSRPSVVKPYIPSMVKYRVGL